jgi:CubicO group peptidase (beta-lactamase class C family)
MSVATDAEKVLRSAVASGATPGAVALVGPEPRARTIATGLSRDGGPEVTPETRYDLASLTKVVATLPAVLRLASEGEISLQDRVGHFFSNAGWAQTPSLADSTVRQLLSHTSGLPAWQPLFAQVCTRLSALAAVLQAPLERRGAVNYSDLGFMLLAAVVERVSGERLDRFTRRQVFGPLGMNETGFGPVAGVPVAASEDCGWRGRLLEGEVHDENATVWDDVAGHAGLFGTAADLGRYCQAWLELDARLGREELLVEATREQARAEDGSRRGLGWLLASEAWFAGRGAGGYGHTGFTGTSLWIDPLNRPAYAVLLTNRVHPHRAQRTGIGELRAAFHQALSRAEQ